MKKTKTIRLSENQIKNLEEIAKAEDRSLSAVVRRAVDVEIEKRIKQKERK